MHSRSIDPATHDPLYTCHICDTPVVAGDSGTYSKEHLYFCSITHLDAYYEGNMPVEEYGLDG